ncbi:MAG TPA: fused MFS/spermidine synthase, partial [Pyrinomonadaceae bacterium]|nr:fused MFS/spermidine synthase [Pyrinomonadaceae bacterium]
VFNARSPTPNVAVVGLGTGATVAYARPNESWTFYEINPAVIQIARDPRLFTNLRDCHQNARVEVALGDARLQLQNAPPHTYGLIVLDAFSSDAVPAHLLTKEALDLYLSKLASGGLLAFHVSSRSLNLHRVVAGLAQSANLYALMFDDGEHDPINGKEPSQWVIVARRAEDLGDLNVDARWQHLDKETHPPIWRDDFSNIVSVFRWK